MYAEGLSWGWKWEKNPPVPCSALLQDHPSPTLVLHSVSQEVSVVFPFALTELVEGGDQFHGWHRGKWWVNVDKETQLSERTGKGAKSEKLSLVEYTALQKVNYWDIKGKRIQGRWKGKLHFMGKMKPNKEKRDWNRSMRREETFKCVPSQRTWVWVWVWKQILTNTNREKKKNVKRKKKRPVS